MLLLNPRVVLAGVGFFVAVFAAVSLHYFQTQTLAAFPSAGQTGPEQAALEADDVQVVGRSGGKVRWRFAARVATLSQDRRTLSVGGIHRGAMYAADGRPVVTLTADHASYATPFGVLGMSGMGTLRVDGHVRASVVSAAHPGLRTEQILWDSASNTLSCPGTATAVMPKLTVSAGNAQYASPPDAPAHGVMRLGGGVRAIFDSARGPATFDCPGLVWNADKQAAQTLGPVTARFPGGLGTATASDLSVSTRTGDLSGHGFRGTLRLSPEVQ